MRHLTAIPLSLALLSALACGRSGEGAGTGETAAIAEVAEIASPTGPGSGEPNLSLGPDGRVLLTWLEPLDSAGIAAASTRKGAFALKLAELRGDVWSEPVTVARGDDFFVNWADFPSAVVLEDGSIAAHWLVRSGASTYAYDIHVARSTDDGRTWSPAVIPHGDGTQSEHGFVSLLPVADSGVRVIWLDGRAYAGAPEGKGHSAVRETVLFRGDAPAAETLLDDRACDCCQTAVVATSAGPVVFYRDRSDAEVRDIYVTRFIAGRWTAPRPVHDDNWVIDACPVNGPAAAATERRIAVAWFEQASDSAHVWVAFSDDAGASFSAPMRVDDGNPSGRVDVELLAGGDALVSWIERVGEGAEVRVRRISSRGRSGAATVTPLGAERASGFPRMVQEGEDVLLAWTETGSPSRVRIARARLGTAR